MDEVFALSVPTSAINGSDVDSGSNEWLNIQPVIRYAFKAILDSIAIQQRQIAALHDGSVHAGRVVDEKIHATRADSARLAHDVSIRSEAVESRLSSRIDAIEDSVDHLKSETVGVQRQARKLGSDVQAFGESVARLESDTDVVRRCARQLETLESNVNAMVETVRGLESEMGQKADRIAIQKALDKKAATSDVREEVEQFKQKLIELGSISRDVGDIARKTDVLLHENISRMESKLKTRIGRDEWARVDELSASVRQVEQQLSTVKLEARGVPSSVDQKIGDASELIRAACQDLIQTRFDAQKEVNAREIVSTLQTIREDLRREIVDSVGTRSREAFVQVLKDSVAASEEHAGKYFQELRDQVTNWTQTELVQRVAADTERQYQTFQTGFRDQYALQWAQESRKLQEELNATRNTLQQVVRDECSSAALALSSKQQDEVFTKFELRLQDIKKLVDQKADARDVEQRLQQSMQSRIAPASQTLSGTPSSSSLLPVRNFDDVNRVLRLKSDTRDVAAVLDQKSDLQNVRNLAGEIQSALDRKAFVTDVNSLFEEQSKMNALLLSQSICGRWLWKNGKVKSTLKMVPWNIQMVNTSPETFSWESDDPYIVCNLPGLYEVTFGFFSKRKPTVQLLVNDEPVLSAVNTASYVVHHSSGRLTSLPHSAGNVAGLTMIDFLALPKRARISVSFSGDSDTDGFIGLKKL